MSSFLPVQAFWKSRDCFSKSLKITRRSYNKIISSLILTTTYTLPWVFSPFGIKLDFGLCVVDNSSCLPWTLQLLFLGLPAGLPPTSSCKLNFRDSVVSYYDIKINEFDIIWPSKSSYRKRDTYAIEAISMKERSTKY